MQFSPGDVVSARGHRWVVDEATAFADCVVLSLSAVEAFDERRNCRLLLPFDRPIKSAELAKVRAVSRRRWMHCLRARLSDLRTFGQLRSASPAAIDILPFQLEPALALITGRASRFLLADEVGLGKTIQAGLDGRRAPESGMVRAHPHPDPVGPAPAVGRRAAAAFRRAIGRHRRGRALHAHELTAARREPLGR